MSRYREQYVWWIITDAVSVGMYIAHFDAVYFEDVIRTSVSLGGDCDTLTCIAGGMAEAFYGVPDDFKKECEDRLPEDALKILHDFSEWRTNNE